MALLNSAITLGQEKDKEFTIPSVEVDIDIDGLGNEAIWDISPWQSSFWMWRPTDSLKAKKQTQFKFLRDNQNIYILINLKLTELKLKLLVYGLLIVYRQLNILSYLLEV